MKWGLKTDCIKKECSPIPLDDLTCFDPEGNEIAQVGKLPENTRCGRICPIGQDHDFSPFSVHDFVSGKETRTINNFNARKNEFNSYVVGWSFRRL